MSMNTSQSVLRIMAKIEHHESKSVAGTVTTQREMDISIDSVVIFAAGSQTWSR
ncbi:MAG: hypothetical protein ABSD72_07710 [Terracidiphilus sp.]